MQIFMPHWKNKIILFAIAVSLVLGASPVFAAEPFRDVDPSSPWAEGIEFVAERGISLGTGDGCFSPDRTIDTNQWAIMVCRAINKENIPETTAGCISRGYSDGWLRVGSVTEPEMPISRGNLLVSAFSAWGIEVYSYELYDGGYPLSPEEECLRVAKELGFYDANATVDELVTRGEAAYIIHKFSQSGVKIGEPPILHRINVVNTDGVPLDPYLLRLNQIPAPILNAFAESGWTYDINSERIVQYGEEHDINCVGLASGEDKRIYVIDPKATVHEFGHFLHHYLRYPTEIDGLYAKEGAAFADINRAYSGKNVFEFFADYFDRYLASLKDEALANELKENTPDTYTYFEKLQANSWRLE